MAHPRCGGPSPRPRRGRGPRRRRASQAPGPPQGTRRRAGVPSPRPARRGARPHPWRSAGLRRAPRRRLPAIRGGGTSRTPAPPPARRARASVPRVSALPQRRKVKRDTVFPRQTGQHPHRDVEIVAGIRQRPQRLVQRPEEVVPVDEHHPAGADRRGLPPTSTRPGSAPVAGRVARCRGTPRRHAGPPVRRGRNPHCRRSAACDRWAGAGSGSTTPRRTGRRRPSPAARRER